MGVVTIRRMTAADTNAVDQIQGASLPNAAAGWSAQDFLNLESWILEVENSVVGFLVGRAVADDEFELLNMAIDPAQRRQGRARHLLEYVLTLHPGMCFLEVRASNGAAQKLYESIGFHACGRRRNYYRSPVEDAIEMSKLS